MDLIDRQAAIDALMEWEETSVWDDGCLKHRGEPHWVAPSDVIERLPYVQHVLEVLEPLPTCKYYLDCGFCDKYDKLCTLICEPLKGESDV